MVNPRMPWPNPWPMWWRVLMRLRLYRLASWIYARLYGTWAPGIIDLMGSTTLHSIGADVTAEWGNR